MLHWTRAHSSSCHPAPSSAGHVPTHSPDQHPMGGMASRPTGPPSTPSLSMVAAGTTFLGESRYPGSQGHESPPLNMTASPYCAPNSTPGTDALPQACPSAYDQLDSCEQAQSPAGPAEGWCAAGLAEEQREAGARVTGHSPMDEVGKGLNQLLAQPRLQRGQSTELQGEEGLTGARMLDSAPRPWPRSPRSWSSTLTPARHPRPQPSTPDPSPAPDSEQAP